MYSLTGENQDFDQNQCNSVPAHAADAAMTVPRQSGTEKTLQLAFDCPGKGEIN